MTWKFFEPIIEEMRHHGMCYFEGFIPEISQSEIRSAINLIVKKSKHHDFSSSVWSNESTSEQWEKTYSDFEHLLLFENDHICTLILSYRKEFGHFSLDQKLMLDKFESNFSLNIICYREAIFENSDVKNRVQKAIDEMSFLKEIFHGNALFVGPATSNYPTSLDSYAEEWLRVE